MCALSRKPLWVDPLSETRKLAVPPKGMLDPSEWSIIESSHHPPHNSKVLPFFLFQALGRRGGPGAVSNPRQQSIDMRKEGLEWRKNGKKNLVCVKNNR